MNQTLFALYAFCKRRNDQLLIYVIIYYNSIIIQKIKQKHQFKQDLKAQLLGYLQIVHSSCRQNLLEQNYRLMTDQKDLNLAIMISASVVCPFYYIQMITLLIQLYKIIKMNTIKKQFFILFYVILITITLCSLVQVTIQIFKEAEDVVNKKLIEQITVNFCDTFKVLAFSVSILMLCYKWYELYLNYFYSVRTAKNQIRRYKICATIYVITSLTAYILSIIYTGVKNDYEGFNYNEDLIKRAGHNIEKEKIPYLLLYDIYFKLPQNNSFVNTNTLLLLLWRTIQNEIFDKHWICVLLTFQLFLKNKCFIYLFQIKNCLFSVYRNYFKFPSSVFDGFLYHSLQFKIRKKIQRNAAKLKCWKNQLIFGGRKQINYFGIKSSIRMIDFKLLFSLKIKQNIIKNLKKIKFINLLKLIFIYYFIEYLYLCVCNKYQFKKKKIISKSKDKIKINFINSKKIIKSQQYLIQKQIKINLLKMLDFMFCKFKRQKYFFIIQP
ncbi:transmembrane protein, putative (macronuclear) [Tetrahymena thermophila SB210]|uniref:Transmembrane protein, putative n=1 Tax=Tetrahymena thermophila (strain SB210) TaxID=312017 RepID=Q22AY0_TETTS|nr:transmembrane protein, putative [Tetrahymena thermophila SB210]EAR82434.2 transmembrane protein, putative [Tetrahymena thermophila SB210]|eukprot:XP_001030097.2 transmembrane protein, putative [Tetrahymena thermophila SB210]